jgi:anaerobic magnesium-protoporphyrin IX monomethyl ester cyclase
MSTLRVVLANIGRRGSYRLVSPPLGLLYLAAYARTQTGADVSIVDQRIDDFSDEETVRRIAESRPDVVGFTCFTSHAHLLGAFTRAIRAALPKALIVLGGPHVTAAGVEALEQSAGDVAVAGEGEINFEQVLRAHADRAGFGHIPGLIWRGPDGAVVANPGEAPVIDDLDSLPFPAYDLIDIRKYWKHWSQSIVPPPRRFVAMFSSRGCPYRCIYCHNVFGKRFRAHSAERIVDEIAHYQRMFGIDEIELFDDIFNFDAGRVIAFSELMRKRGLRIKIALPNSVRTDILTQETVDALVDAGLYIAAFALESGSPRVQQYIGKRLNIPRYLKAVEMAVKRGVFAYGFQMFGFPTETLEEAQQTIDVVCESRLHAALYYRVMPYPNTELYDIVKRDCPDKLARVDFAETDYTYKPIVNLSDIPDADLDRCIRRGTLRFYGNPGRLLRILRDYPRRLQLPLYAPRILFLRLNRTAARAASKVTGA